MAKKKVNRKKQLRKQFAAMKKAGKMVMDAAGSAVETATERVQDVVETVSNKASEGKKAVKKAAKDFEGFAKELEGVAVARLETFYEEGIQSAKDFSKWTEKELLALKGIGPATIKQLKELGIKLKG